jgi:hypothetical protein
MQDRHIAVEEILELIDQETPANEETIKKHLLKCELCRKVYARQFCLHREVETALKDLIATTPTKACLTNEEMSRYPDPNFSKKEIENMTAHIKSCAHCSIRLKLQLVTHLEKEPSAGEMQQRIMDIYRERILAKLKEPPTGLPEKRTKRRAND